MASRQSDKYGNPAHHTGHLGAPGTTGAFETHDPLGAPGTTGASPTTGYNTSGGQEQLHRPAGHHVPLNATGTTGQGYAYGTAASMGHVGHAQVAVPHTSGLTGTYDTGAHTSESDRIGGAGQGIHRTEGYDTGSFGGGTDIGHIGHEGRHGAAYDTSVDKGRGGGYDILGKGVGGAHGGGYDTGGDEGRVSGYDTLLQGVGSSETHGQGLGGGHEAGGYEAGSDWTHSQGVREHGSGYDTGGNKSPEQGVKEDSASGYDTGGDWTHGQVVREHGGKYDIGGDKTCEERHSGCKAGTGEQVHGGVSATVVEVVTEEPLQEDESKGFIDRIMEHLPGTGAGTK